MNASTLAAAIAQAKATHKIVSDLEKRTFHLVRQLTKPITLPDDGRTDYHTPDGGRNVDQIPN